MNLPELYSAVVAKRPELAVTRQGSPVHRLEYHEDDRMPGWEWRHTPTGGWIGFWLDDQTAAALILARWLEMPSGFGLVYLDGLGWTVFQIHGRGTGGYELVGNCYADPIEAAGVFHMGCAT